MACPPFWDLVTVRYGPAFRGAGVTGNRHLIAHEYWYLTVQPCGSIKFRVPNLLSHVRVTEADPAGADAGRNK